MFSRISINPLKLVLMLLATGALLLVGWLSLSLVWYPSYDELELDILTSEADVLQRQCAQSATSSMDDNVLKSISEHETPYTYALVVGQKRFRCGDGVRLVLWDDYLLSSSGLYIVDNDKQLPDRIAADSVHLGGRVYQWHGETQ